MSRRLLLRGLVASCVLGATAACSPSPIIDPSKAPTPQPTPTLDDQRQTAAQLELDLASSCQRAAAQPANAGQQAWLTATAELHRQHHVVLAQRDPFGGVQADHTPIEELQPANESPTEPQQIAELAARVAAQHVEQLAVLEDPLRALLWTSLAACARMTADSLLVPDPPLPTAGQAVPSKVEIADQNSTLATLIGHQQALLFGLETLLGKTSNVDFRSELRARLAAVKKLLDQTRELATQQGMNPTPAAAQYQVKADADDAARRAEWRTLENNVAAAWAPVVAATPSAQRGERLADFVKQLKTTQQLGVALTHWPGWR